MDGHPLKDNHKLKSLPKRCPQDVLVIPLCNRDRNTDAISGGTEYTGSNVSNGSAFMYGGCLPTAPNTTD